MNYIIRRAEPTDAAHLIRYMKLILSEPNHNMRRDADEYTKTVDQEERSIVEHNRSTNSLFLVAVAEDGQIVGQVTCTGSHLRAELHTTELGISVHPDWRGKGVGKALMQAALDWARASTMIKRVFLYVFARNANAVRLYENLGFEIEGRLRKDMYRNDEYLDTLFMGLLLE